MNSTSQEDLHQAQSALATETVHYPIKRLLCCTLSQLNAEKSNTKEWELSVSRTFVSYISAITIFVLIVSFLNPATLKQILEKAGLQYVVRIPSEDEVLQMDVPRNYYSSSSLENSYLNYSPPKARSSEFKLKWGFNPIGLSRLLWTMLV